MRRLWLLFIGVIAVSFSVLGWVGTRIYQEAPPIPNQVLTPDGAVVIDQDQISRGQNVWQAMGGMEVGSVWGHGSYVAPDWTADWLHREAVFILNEWARADFKAEFKDLPDENKSQLEGRLQTLLRKNTFDPEKKTILIDPIRARAFEDNQSHFADVFVNGRTDYAIPKGAVTDPARLRDLSAFFFWTSWAASTNRPHDHITYTHNWPYEPLVGNRPSGEMVVWTGVSVLMLLGGIAAMVCFYVMRGGPSPEKAPEKDPLIGATLTQSQKATLKYFWVVSALIVVQILAGVITAHFGVEGGGLYGFPLDRWLPYSVSRTWHVQLGILWIATAWLAAGLFIGPTVSGEEPKGQALGVNILFGALLVVVAGSMTGQWLSIFNKLNNGNLWFYFGHQGYEYVDLGRVWQIGLFIGLLLWLFLVTRSIIPAFRKPGEHKHLLALFLVSTTAIGLFYGAGLSWGRQTHLSIVEYWRWWVIHLWVEGFFEVFATVVIAFFFTKLNLIKPLFAAEAALLSATVYLSGGIIGTLHHLYFAGTPTVALAWGSVFSALEVVPLLLVSYAAWDDYRLSKANDWVKNYRWPIYYFLAVAFWNMLGAGLFGFMINPPIALYYMQGLNTTPVHAHAALFGVYGMLGIGLMLFCLKAMNPTLKWNEKVLKFSFWSMNIGLMAMIVLSLLPVGLFQTWASVEHGYWYARSGEFLKTPLMQTLRWLRVPGDTLFAIGALVLTGFVFSVSTKLFKQSSPVLSQKSE